MVYLFWFLTLIFVYWLVYIKSLEKMTITHDTQNKVFDKEEVNAFVKKHFNGVCTYDSVANVVYICDNKIMTDPKFIELLSKWKVFIQPSLF